MVGGAPQVLEQPSVPQTLTSEEEEAVKRNTDCVYFLASPLTCKKGSECEYRHSEYARVNPRDCWFWLNGNCLNLKCGFRHPPLDGLVGGTHTTNPASSQIPSQTSSIPVASTHNPFNSSKQPVPCVFFQKGMCLKGDRCAFLHGPPPTLTNKVPQAPANAQSGDFPSLKKVSGGIQRCSQEQKIAQANFSKSIGAPPKLTSKDETMASKTGNNNEKSGPATEVDDGGSKYKATNSYPILNESSFSRTNRLQQSHVPEDRGLQNGKDVDEFKESSPGFDVLVDDELRGSGYYGGEETYGRTRGHEGTNMISVNEYGMNHSVDYKMTSDIDQDIYNNELVDYDYDSRQQRQYGWEQHRSPSEKLSLESTHMESRRFRKSNSPERAQNMDLRLRLNKHRRGNGLRSTINNEAAASRPVEERNYRASRRDSQESSVSSRLHGRIKLPRIPSPVRNNNLPPERDLNRGRNWGRSSPGRSQSSSYLGCVRDEIKGRVEEDHNNERRNFNGFSSRRDRMDGTFHFAAPKSLAELKGEKPLVRKEQQTLGKRKSLEDNEQFGSEVSFKGPKSLSEILKKKRQVEAAVKLPVNNAERENRERLIEHSVTPIMKQSGLSSTAKQEADSLILSQEGTKSAPAKTVGTEEEKIVVSHSQSSQVMHSTDHENEDGMAYDETLEEEHEYEEADDQREGEYEYEQGDDGEYNYEEGDNVYPEEDEYMDDEDGDDFAKKIGVMS